MTTSSPVATPDNPGLRSWGLLIFGSLLWGSAFMSMAVALDGYGPLTVSAGRALIGGLALLAIGQVIGQGPAHIPNTRGWVFVAVIGIINIAVPFSLITWGLQHVPSAFAGVAMGTVGLMVIPLAYVFLPDEGIGPRRIIGMVLGFIGVVVLVGPGNAETTGSPYETLGGLACVAAAVCYACGSIITRRAPPMPALPLTAAMLTIAALFLLPLALVVEGLPEITASKATLALVYAGLIPTGFAFVLRTHIIRTAGSLFMSLATYMIPLWAVFFGIVILGEAVTSSLYLATGLILSGVALTQWRKIRRLFAR